MTLPIPKELINVYIKYDSIEEFNKIALILDVYFKHKSVNTDIALRFKYVFTKTEDYHACGERYVQISLSPEYTELTLTDLLKY